MTSNPMKKLAEDVLVGMYQREPNIPGQMFDVNWFCRSIAPHSTTEEIQYVAGMLGSWGCGNVSSISTGGASETGYAFTMRREGLKRAEEIQNSQTFVSKLTSEKLQKLLNLGAFLVSVLSLAVAVFALSRTSS